MNVTATELKNRLGHYLKAAETEEIKIFSRGTYVASLTTPAPTPDNKLERARRLFGIVSQDMSLENIREGRRQRYDDNA